MKKLSCLVLILMLLLCGAMAEPEWMVDGAAVQLDLNGDGVQEELSYKTYAINEYDEAVEISVKSASGEVRWGVPLYSVQVCALDADGDGMMEIFVSGDQMSDDYITYCLRYDGIGMMQLDFADINRGENSDGYYDYGYGRLIRAEDGIIELEGSQDFLGTYMATRVLALQDGRFEVVDDGVWRVNVDMERFEWEYAHLLAAQDIPVTFFGNEGEEDGILRAGEKALITGSDKIAVAYFVTEDGRTGFFRIAPDTVNGWGSLVNGIPEAEAFEYVPYAD